MSAFGGKADIELPPAHVSSSIVQSPEIGRYAMHDGGWLSMHHVLLARRLPGAFVRAKILAK